MNDGVKCSGPKRITEEMFKFYSHLNSHVEQTTSSFFDELNNLIPVIDENFKKTGRKSKN